MSSSGPIICSSFDPSNGYLATALVALDTHQIKVQSVNPSQSSLNASFNLDKANKITQLQWINSSVQLLAVCLTKGSILVYSPQTNEIVAELTSSANVSITDFHYSKTTHTGWSSDIEGNVYEWNMDSYTLIQSFKIGDVIEGVDSINRISTIVYNGQVHLLLGSHAIYLVDAGNKRMVKTFPGHIQPVNSLVPVPDHPELFLTSAKGDRFVNLYSVDKVTTKAVFVSSSSVLEISVGIRNDKSILVAINENGNLEVFNDPLSDSNNTTTTTPKKKKRKQPQGTTSRSSNAAIKLSRPEPEIKSPQDSNLRINSISINDDSVLFTWLENSSIPFFDSVQWIDETGKFSLESQTISKARPDLKTTQHTVSGHDVAAAKLYSEGHAIVSDGTNIRDLDKDDEDEGEESEQEESLAEKLDRLAMDKPKPAKKKLEDARTGASLAVILSQSLKNNDQSLLETVLTNRDPQIIQNTISRLNPYLAVVLLDRLSEKIQRQSSRFDQLNYWLKWILVIHGAVIASLPNLSVKLSSLHSVLIKKADTMPRLLELQGRLNMLYEQNELKNELLTEEYQDEDHAGESDVEYIEELDDAQFNGEIDEDELMEFEGEDDYIESEDEEEEEEEDDDGDIPAVADLDEHSDLEIDA
ncbi:uncharacterized protein SPAPADRAFT_59082 [Spathaspora passalidarum NRRL Y-27907]|uniref:Small-subunit processome Utp12 domain-containing protein n=1 Tax=Spathaspora passalidarum (strain NRRL Y-27907 / 11-Y1) TaxID=619300 RepID=G3AIK3_SPAPN|nr:uncharacterized protein SPAPADRAFT_59082 [Spathaspora passalidarum NRRL Y-27907]EGW33718.1 hypothetical protein SPAPADRAFT_59082 [Spathaspora passalidarum NRRL Y-27907]